VKLPCDCQPADGGKLHETLTLALVRSLQSPAFPLDRLRRKRALVGQRWPAWRSGGEHLCQRACGLHVARLCDFGAIAFLPGLGGCRRVRELASMVVDMLRLLDQGRPGERDCGASNLGVD
jgi:hypothetical protein